MLFRLRYLQHDFELSPGRFLIGRSSECQLSLDDPLVSRRHALLIVTSESVEVQDLGSRNGVLVSGARIEGSRKLNDGDTLTIGSQELSLHVLQPSSRPVSVGIRRHRIGAETVTSLEPARSSTASIGQAESSDDESIGGVDAPTTTKQDAFMLLGGVADKALALGRTDEAERLLTSLLSHVLASLRTGGVCEPSLIEQAALYGSKLAIATSKVQWIDYVIELHTLARRPCAAQIIDDLHIVLRKTRNINLFALRRYAQLMREIGPSFGPAERFLVQRIEGLERLVTLQ